VRVEGAPDTVVVWNPAYWHGTSLQEISPLLGEVGELYQSGLAICTPARFGALLD